MTAITNSVAAITGAGSGIGQALANRLAEAGGRVALSDVDEDALARTAASLRLRYGRERVAEAVVDVADRSAVHAWADAVAEQFGEVNLVFNNAGVALGATIEGASYDDLEWIMGINFWGVVYGTKAFLPYLKAAGRGHVVNVSSVFGLVGIPSQGAYNASKFAVRGFTEALRQELDLQDCGVTATSVHPGGIKTNIAKAARYGDMAGVSAKSESDSKALFEKTFRTTADQAAAAILKGVERDARRVLIGPDARVIDTVQRLMPTAYQRLVTAGTRRFLR